MGADDELQNLRSKPSAGVSAAAWSPAACVSLRLLGVPQLVSLCGCLVSRSWCLSAAAWCPWTQGGRLHRGLDTRRQADFGITGLVHAHENRPYIGSFGMINPKQRAVPAGLVHAHEHGLRHQPTEGPYMLGLRHQPTEAPLFRV